MKKLCILLLALSVLSSMLTGCFYAPGQTPMQTTDSGEVTTAVPNSPNDEPKTFLSTYSLGKPYATSEECAAWRESLNLPQTPPENSIDHQVLFQTGGFPFFSYFYGMNGAALITNTDELDAFLELPKTNYPLELDLSPFDSLREIDYTQNVVLVIGRSRSYSRRTDFNQIFCYGNSLIVGYTDPTVDGGSDASSQSWCHAILINRADLPTIGNDLQILFYTDYPNITDPQLQEQYQGYPTVYYAERVLFGEMPAPTLNVRDIETPYSETDEYQAWLAGLQLPEVLPTTELAYETLFSFRDICENTVISSVEELYAFAYHNQAFEEGELSQFYEPYRTIYNALKTVDFTQKAVVIVGMTTGQIIEVDLDKVLIHGNNLIAAFSSPMGVNDDASTAMDDHCFVLLVDKAELPASEDGLTILSYIAFPNQDRTGYPYVEFYGQTVFEEKE